MRVLLIPGMWQGAWAWEPVLDRLLAQEPASGVEFEACNLPMAAGTDLSAHVDCLKKYAEAAAEQPLILVAHSYGGTPALMLADALPERVAAFLLVDAALPQNGKSVIDGYTSAHRENLHNRFVETGSGQVLPPQSAEALGIKDLQATEVFDRLACPFPFAAMREPVRLGEHWKTIAIRRAILAARGPRGGAEARANYTVRCTIADIKLETWDCSHQVMTDAPDLLANAILSIADATLKEKSNDTV